MLTPFKYSLLIVKNIELKYVFLTLIQYNTPITQTIKRIRWTDSPDEKVGRSLVEIQNGSVGVTATNKTQPDPENWRKSARDNRQRVAIEVLWVTESVGTEEHCELSVWLVAPGPHWAPPPSQEEPPHATPPLLIGRPARSCPINNCIVLPQRDNTVKNWAKRGRASLVLRGGVRHAPFQPHSGDSWKDTVDT